MRVLLLTPSYPPMIGGGEAYAAALAADLARRGHDVTVVTSAIAQQSHFWAGTPPAAPDTELESTGVRVVRLPVRPATLGRWGQLALRKGMVLAAFLGKAVEPLLARCSRAFPPIVGLEAALSGLPCPDLVHAFNISWENCLLGGHAFAQAAGVPYVVTPFLHVGGPGQQRVWRNSAMPQQRRVLVEAEAVLALTATERDGIVALGVRPQAVHVVGAAVLPQPDATLHPTTRLVTMLTASSAPLILMLGRADRDKGALTAMRAVSELHGRGVPCQLALAGSPSPDAQRLARRLSLTGAPIHLLGAVDEDDKSWLLRYCYALVLPSRVESFGLVLLEAWRAGKPVIAAAVGGPRDLVQPGVNGLLTPWDDAAALADALRDLLANPRRASEMGAAGRAMAASAYAWPAVADRVEAVYRVVLSGTEATGRLEAPP